MTTSKETDWMNHPAIRQLVEAAARLTPEERITMVKGLIPALADALPEDDFHEFIKLLDQVNAFTIGSDNATDIEDVVTLYSLAGFAVRYGYLTEEDSGTEARRARLVSELERIAAIEAAGAHC